MEDTEARGIPEDQEVKAPKKVRLSDEEEQDEEIVESEIADTNVAQSGSAHGAAAQGDKRKREMDDVKDRSMDMDSLTEVKSLGMMLSRMSRVDPEIDSWAKSVNEHNSIPSDGSPSGVTHGDAAGGDKDWKQIFKKWIKI